MLLLYRVEEFLAREQNLSLRILFIELKIQEKNVIFATSFVLNDKIFVIPATQSFKLAIHWPFYRFSNQPNISIWNATTEFALCK